MTLADFQNAELADEVLARKARTTARWVTVLGAPEAEGRDLVAFALLLRLDLSAEEAVLYLREAPPLHTVADVQAWVEMIPQQPEKETCQ